MPLVIKPQAKIKTKPEPSKPKKKLNKSTIGCKSKRDLGLDFLELKTHKIKKPKKKQSVVSKYVQKAQKTKGTKHHHAKESKIVNITVQKQSKLEDDTTTCYNYQIEDRNRTFEDYQKFKKNKEKKQEKIKRIGKDKVKIVKNPKIKSMKVKDEKPKIVKKYPETAKSKKKVKERLEVLKSKRTKHKNAFKLLQNVQNLPGNSRNGSKTRKMHDRSYNGAIPASLAHKLKKKRAGSAGSRSRKCSKSSRTEQSLSENLIVDQKDESSVERPYEDSQATSNYLKYKSMPDCFRRREQSLDQLRASLQTQIEELGAEISQSLAMSSGQVNKSHNFSMGKKTMTRNRSSGTTRISENCKNLKNYKSQSHKLRSKSLNKSKSAVLKHRRSKNSSR